MPNSTSPVPDFFDYLARSFRLLEAGIPAAYQALCAAAGELSVRLVATDDARVLRFHGSIPIFEPDQAADLDVVFDHRVILDLIDGCVSIEDALVLDRLWIRGTPGALEQFHAALMFYLNGAIRLSECLELLRCFRTAALQYDSRQLQEGRDRHMYDQDLKDQRVWDLDDPDYNAPLVTIFGAGIAGLTVAHELVERGFHVQVVEPKESQSEEYECEIGGMAANQFSRVPASLRDVHPELVDAEDEAALNRIREVRRVYEELYEFERAQPRFPIKHRIRFHKRIHRPDGTEAERLGGLEEGTTPFAIARAERSVLKSSSSDFELDPERREKVPLDWREYWDDHGVKNLSKLDEVLHIIKDAHTFYDARYREREAKLESPYDPQEHALSERDRRRDILLVKIFGYTDSDGLAEHNRQTGEYWATQVRDALLALNDKLRREFQVPHLEDHLEAVGAGFARQLGPQTDRAARARSNRVEFQIVEQLLPGEHGFRFFPNFYRHLFDTMRRTPILSDLDPESRLTAFDQLVATPEAFLALEDDLAPFRIRLRRFRTLTQIREALECFLGRLRFAPSDLTMFNLKFQRYMTSCEQRRRQEAEDCNFIEYFGGVRAYTRAALRFLDSTPRALAAMSATETDARTQCDVVLQLMGQDPLQPFVDDMTLNGPTTDAWLLHWKGYLKRQGVRFFVGRLSQLHLEGHEFIPMVDGPGTDMVPRPEDPRHRLRGRMVDGSERLIGHSGPAQSPSVARAGRRREFYVMALPFEAASDLAQRAQRTADQAGLSLQGPFRQLVEYNEYCGYRQGDRRHRNPVTGRPCGRDPLRDISGVQYFFPNNYRLGAGHVYWVDSPWALTSISQLAYWRDRIRPLGDYIGQLSVDLGSWYDNYPTGGSDGQPEPGHTAWHSSRWEIAQNCWQQIKAGLSSTQRSEINPPRFYHLDLGIVFEDEKHIGSRGNLILKMSPAALRRTSPGSPETCRLLISRSWVSEEEERLESLESVEYTIDSAPFVSTDRDAIDAALYDLSQKMAVKINSLRNREFVFAVHELSQLKSWKTQQMSLSVSQPEGSSPEFASDYEERLDPAEILLSPVIQSDRIVIYFRGDSDYCYYIRINGMVLVIPPAPGTVREDSAKRPPASSTRFLPKHYVDELEKHLRAMGELLEIEVIGNNHAIIKTTKGEEPITCAVANRDDMIEVVDGPKLEVMSRFPNVQVVARPRRTSGVGRTMVFRANALVEAEARPPGEADAQWEDLTAGAEPRGEETAAHSVYPEPGRLYRLSVSVPTAEGTTTLRAGHEAEPKESANSLFDKLFQTLHSAAPHELIHAELTTVEDERPAILISPYAHAAEITIRVTGSSPRTFKVIVDGVECKLTTAANDAARDIRDALLQQLSDALGRSPRHADIVATALGQRCIRLSRSANGDGAPASGGSFAVTVCNLDGMIEMIGAPVVEIRTKDLAIRASDRDPLPLRNDTPFLINPPGHWKRRPGHAAQRRPRATSRSAFPGKEPLAAGAFEYGHPACRALQSWIAAGTYMTTYTRLTTMEAANESGRHAVNAILNQLLDDADQATRGAAPSQSRRRLFGDYCRTWDLEDEEFEDLKFFKELDARLLDEGLPHVHDILPMYDGVEVGLDLANFEQQLRDELPLRDATILAALSGLAGSALLSRSMLHQARSMADLLRRMATRAGGD